ncbi:MAG: glycosyltransferase family 2 protein [Halobacteriovoraceae bacterium]|nr:glycosyltransferase family 2 protein [Halobacteriovoraceae bacterium]MCB9094185.1 glycosyltransferase family 2 protein [Halobacteriovoraceae bacterium]
MSKKTISIVIPVFNEGRNIFLLFEQLKTLFENDKYEYFVLFADDGSQDETLANLQKIASENFQVDYLSLSRNFGHQAALTAGLEHCHATSKAVIMMDGDLEHPPEVIPQLLEKWEEGYDVVYTIRQMDLSLNVIKRWATRIFYKIFHIVSDVELVEGSADFRLWDRKVLDSYKKLKERNRFIRGLSVWLGFRQTGITYKQGSRQEGRSKYSFRKMLRLAIEGITSFSAAPLYFAVIVGISLLGLGFLYGFYVFYLKLFTNYTIQGWTSIILTLLFVSGIQISILGIVGIYLAKIFDESKDRPIYLIKKSSLGIEIPS